MEMQRRAMLMYTSCGWFFDELSGIETVQVIQYAGRVVQLAQESWATTIEGRLPGTAGAGQEQSPGTWGRPPDLREVRQTDHGGPAQRGGPLRRQLALRGLPSQARIFCYTVDREDFRLSEAGNAKLAVGRIRMTSEITRNSATLSFAVLHFGDHNLCGGVREFQGEEAYEAMAAGG